MQINVPPQATTGFENTLATLMGRVSYRANDMVTNIDPDAPARQKKSLHDLDNRDESEFAKLMYVYIRAGMLEAAQEVCEQSGHPWRAGNFGIFWHFLFIFAQGCLKQIKNIGYLL